MLETDSDKACQVAERVRQCISGLPIAFDYMEQIMTLSLGVADIRSNIHTLDDLLKDADQALYAAKVSGRNRVAVFDNSG